ncbi:pyocin knob domain-containing protein [Pseudomonas aeruginosa]|uniref:pyocin knob domain-containing protein n=1 Tax=Pseudomonas aeruginosa TaxID=287 RepID=UPI0028CFAAB3|nr:pyocin knob domain-containing protein [Pseudomonas aeruginosa]MDT8245445.1 pyocin knob domain-containing protein [Pseudomonas aeruginosa]
MADVRPTKLQNDGNGYGSLREFADGDTVPLALGGTGAATAAGARSNLFDPRLQSFSLLLGGVDQLPYQTGPNSWSQTPLTSIGRAMIAASTQANALSYIGGVPKSLSSNRTVSDPNTVPDECGFYGIGAGPYSNLPPGIDALNPIGSMLYHHPYDVATAVQLFVPRTSNILYFRRRVAGVWQSWVRVLSDAQIMGTVSVDGSGNPNGALFQNGSSANGDYVRFADGTQITRTRIIGSRATGTHSITIAAAFTSGQDTAVFVNWVPGTNWPASPGNGIRGIYLQSASVVTFYLNDAMGTNDSLVITAIGRWRA